MRFMFNSGGLGGNDQYTQVLLHFDGTNGSTSFIDSNRNNARTWQGTTASLSTTQAKFGPTSLNVIGKNWASPWLPYTNNLTGITWGTNNFTIDFWVYPISATQGYTLMWQADSGTSAANTSVFVQLNPDNTVRVIGSDGTTVGAVFYSTTGAVTYSTWNHIAVVRNGNVFTTYVNGVASGTQTANVSIVTPTIYPLVIGPFDSASEFPGNCYIDEFRLSIGVARWTSNFTPNSLPYS